VVLAVLLLLLLLQLLLLLLPLLPLLPLPLLLLPLPLPLLLLLLVVLLLILLLLLLLLLILLLLLLLLAEAAPEVLGMRDKFARSPLDFLLDPVAGQAPHPLLATQLQRLLSAPVGLPASLRAARQVRPTAASACSTAAFVCLSVTAASCACSTAASNALLRAARQAHQDVVHNHREQVDYIRIPPAVWIPEVISAVHHHGAVPPSPGPRRRSAAAG